MSRASAPRSVAVFALAGALTVGLPSEGHASVDRPVPAVAHVASTRSPAAKPMTFKASSPKSVRTKDRFKVTASLPRGYASSVGVIEMLAGKKWLPLQVARVSLKGSIGIRTQLSERGTYQLRMRIASATRPAISNTLTVRSSGPRVKSQGPLRMLAHWVSNGKKPALGPRMIGPRAEEVPGTEPAAEAASAVDGVMGFASDTTKVVGEETVGFGVDLLMGLIFPGTATATEQQIDELEAQVQEGFDNVYFDLGQLQTSIQDVQVQNSEIFAEAALGDCSTAINGVQADVTTIQDAFANYQDVMTQSWGEANLSYAAGVGNSTVIGNYVFGVGSNGTPSFGPGVNKVLVAVQDLQEAFTESGPLNIINTCADGMAAYTIQQRAASIASVTDQVPVGYLDTAYFEAMQGLAGEYAAIMSTGLALGGIGNLLAATTLVPASVQTVPQFLAACQELDVFSCPETALQLQQGQAIVGDIWHSVGASWGQVTNGLLESDLYAYQGSDLFSNGQNAWLTDISAFQNNMFGLGIQPGTPVSATNNHGPTAGIASFDDSTWGPSASPFGVPPPNSYTVGLYAPTVCAKDDSCATPALSAETIDVSGARGPNAVFDLFTLGKDSAPGVYTVVVYGTSVFGQGVSARSSVLITAAYLKKLTQAQDAIDLAKSNLPTTLEALNRFECSRGLLSGSTCETT